MVDRKMPMVDRSVGIQKGLDILRPQWPLEMIVIATSQNCICCYEWS